MNLNFSKIMPQKAHSKRTWKDRLPYLLAFFIPVLSMIDLYRKGNLPIWRPFFFAY